jgi:hypothetical protein
VTVKRLHLDDEGSISGIAYFVIVLFVSLFAYIGLGEVVDRMLLVNIALNSTINGSIPVSVERVNTLNSLVTGVKVFPLIGSLIPLILYSWVVAKRRAGSEV